MSTCHRLDLQTLGPQPITPKNLPGHGTVVETLMRAINHEAACTIEQKRYLRSPPLKNTYKSHSCRHVHVGIYTSPSERLNIK